MTPNAFFIGRAIVLVLLLVLGIGIFALKSHAPAPAAHEPVAEDLTEAPAFAWTFADSASLNLDGNPQTDVFLTATHADGTVETKQVDTVPGGCSVLPDLEEGSIEGAPAAQCYYAGLGQRYRIVEGDREYAVERKVFEEASPEHEPPQEEYERVASFPR